MKQRIRPLQLLRVKSALFQKVAGGLFASNSAFRDELNPDYGMTYPGTWVKDVGLHTLTYNADGAFSVSVSADNPGELYVYLSNAVWPDFKDSFADGVSLDVEVTITDLIDTGIGSDCQVIFYSKGFGASQKLTITDEGRYSFNIPVVDSYVALGAFFFGLDRNKLGGTTSMVVSSISIKLVV